MPENNPGNPSSVLNPPVPMPLPQPVFIESLNGLPVKLRSGPSTSCALYWEIPSGAEAILHSRNESWCRVTASDLSGKTRTGWIMTDFVVPGSQRRVLNE